MQPQNHACRFEEIVKTKLQASAASAAKTLQSQNRWRAKIRLSLNGLQVVHGRLIHVANGAIYLQPEWLELWLLLLGTLITLGMLVGWWITR